MISNLEDFKVYNLAMSISEEVWILVASWGYFEKDTVGRQLVKAVDSIAANLSESLGRYHFKEAKQFSYYSRGSLFETKTWLTKARSRQLISEDKFQSLIFQLDQVGKMLNKYINSIGSSNVSEPNEDYQVDFPTTNA
jgi:four helix bundle protein